MGNDINVLVVDDEEDMCWALENILKTEGYNIVTTTSGNEAIKLIKKKTIDITFVDIKLPDIDGIELARLIKKEDSQIGIIMISGYYYEDDSDIQKGLHDGTYLTFVGKPFDNVEVRKAAQNVLDLRKR
ncbi:MAG: response regulator receiver protein [Candidatus Scalindua rubra]|uniref:Response regulator receiver protein n=1 Tax=Candidatus Scalindua rubra TaxID=1872076 RepID=A0A1E3XHC4_9BACT|nr:MAG: response regulator receiver protein [Candidatus Scalindua rubra]